MQPGPGTTPAEGPQPLRTPPALLQRLLAPKHGKEFRFAKSETWGEQGMASPPRGFTRAEELADTVLAAVDAQTALGRSSTGR